MLIQEILSETMSGGIAIVAQPMGKVIKRPNPSVFGTTKTKKKKLPEGEERSIIRDAAINYLVKAFKDKKDEFESREALEANIWSVLSNLDVEDIVDPEMDHHGQRMGNFASGRVIDVIDGMDVGEEVMQQINYRD